jgi:hypothetical protein
VKEFTLSSYPRCVDTNNSSATSIPCTEAGANSIAFMGYSVRTRAFRYTQWRKWSSVLQMADWSNSGIVGVELYDHRANTLDINPALFENENLAGTIRYSMIETSLKTQLETRVKSPQYSNRRCGKTVTFQPRPGLCTTALDEETCNLLFVSRCAWFLGYGCQDSTFCGFKTNERVKKNKKTGLTPFNLPENSPGCALFSSRCQWKINACLHKSISNLGD